MDSVGLSIDPSVLVEDLSISHRQMDEIFSLCDRLHVLRDGIDVGTVHCSETDRDEVVQMMVGREIGNLFWRDKTELGNEVLRVQGLCSENGIRDVSFSVRKGEIVGIAGLVGSGSLKAANCR